MTKEEVLEKTGMTVGVNNADFSIKRGEIFVIMGLSGLGKSTLVRMFNRLIKPSAGEPKAVRNERAAASLSLVGLEDWEDQYPTIIRTRKGDIRSALELLNARDFNHGYVLNAKRQFLGIVSIDSLQQAMEAGRSGESIEICYLPEVNPAHVNDNIQDILPEVASKDFPIPVVDDNNAFKGVVSKNRFLKTLHKSEINGHNGSGNAYEDHPQTIHAAR